MTLGITSVVTVWPGTSSFAPSLLGGLLVLVGATVLLVWVRFARHLIGPAELMTIPFYLVWKVPVYLSFVIRAGRRPGIGPSARRATAFCPLLPRPVNRRPAPASEAPSTSASSPVKAVPGGQNSPPAAVASPRPIVTLGAVATMRDSSTVGCVAIGRNEGERLRHLLCSRCCAPWSMSCTSTRARTTAASAMATRARRRRRRPRPRHPLHGGPRAERRLPAPAARAPRLELVQFVDGDCEVVAGWLERAVARLSERPEVAVVVRAATRALSAGVVYNRMCDLEWDTPVGDARACGGDAMIRVAALVEVGGYNPDLIAGEEPELCVRLRARGRHHRAPRRRDDPCTTPRCPHASQWWQRSVRAGHAYAEGVAMHGAPPERHCVAEYRRALFWAAGVPALALGSGAPHGGREPRACSAAIRCPRRGSIDTCAAGGSRPRDAALAAVLLTLGKFAELQGILKYHWSRLSGQRSTIIEYKDT